MLRLFLNTILLMFPMEKVNEPAERDHVPYIIPHTVQTTLSAIVAPRLHPYLLHCWQFDLFKIEYTKPWKF